ncbi:alpha/beta fold hydrolase [Acidisoma sp. 7E03]
MKAHLLLDGLPLAFTDEGAGLPVLFQHGLGGHEGQIRENFPEDLTDIRRLTLECRGHGASPPDPAGRYAIRLFAADCLALADARRARHFVAGGISMGAAIALHLACHHPARVRALILARPAWLCGPAPANLQAYGLVGRLLREAGPVQGRARFDASETAAALAQAAPGTLATLQAFFDHPKPRELALLLERIAADGPGVSPEQLAALRLPTLVIGHGVDHAHPWAYAEELAAMIPEARLVEIPPKATAPEAHRAAFQAAVARFLQDLPAWSPEH